MIIAEAGDVFRQAIMITGFVFVMMLVIEYINVQTKGLWHTQFLGNNRKQYIVAALLGVIPGCLGAFTAVSLFSHRSISQDGHGSLPLLAESKRGFLYVKSVNMVVALVVGVMGYIMKL